MMAFAFCAFLAVFILNPVKPEIEVTEPPLSFEGESCGGDITADTGTIQSPNYPENYGPNASCFWKITVPENFQIRLHFKELDLEYTSSCTFDYVEVFDGHDPGSRVLHKLCGYRVQQTVMSSGNKMAVKFSSDQTTQDSGFLAEFRKVPQCGGNIAAEEGVIQSRGYPDNYSPNDICTWKITVPENKAVLLKFKALQIEESIGCKKDYVEVLDGHDATSAILDRKCGLLEISGETSSLDVRSLGHKITVRFVSDAFGEDYGFLAEFQTVEVNTARSHMLEPTFPIPGTDETASACMNAIDYEKGTLVSPHFPEKYKPNEECTWNITGPPGSRINLRFKMLDLESSNTCSYDYVFIPEASQVSSASGRIFCGTISPGLITSSGNEMTVTFKADSATEGKGFIATFNASEGSIIEPEVPATGEDFDCKDDIISDEGIIHSPNYPENYGPNEKCLWKMSVPTGHQVVLKFNEFRVEKHIRCAYDYVLVRDGHSLHSPILAKFCGFAIPVEVRSCKNKLMIEFHSDSSIEHSGFWAEFRKDLPVLPNKALSPDLVPCGGDTEAERGIIQSPNYPQPYGPLENCTWRITAPENYLVSLTFEYVNLEHSPECSFDKVTVLDGDNVYSPVMIKLCDSGYVRSHYVSSQNQMTVQFTSDDSFENEGFRAAFQKVFACGGNITADTGVLQSPNVAGAYHCTWRISVPEDYKVFLKIHKNNKKYIYYRSLSVAVHDGPDKESDPIKTFSTLDQDLKLLSSGNEMFVTVFSDDPKGLLRFDAEFEKVSCGGDIVADSGTIMTPQYPNNYLSNEECTWKITVPEGYKVLLTFQTFELEGGPSTCDYDFVEVYDGHVLSGSKIGRYCGEYSEIPHAILSSSNRMALKFKTDLSTDYKGFLAQFEKDQCGGNITAERGVISSPKYPGTYPSNSDCTWKITVPEDNVVVLQFESFDVAYTSQCRQDFVEILGGHNPWSWPLGKFCGSDIPSPVTSRTNKLSVRFLSDNRTEAEGFKAEFFSEVSKRVSVPPEE